MSTWQPVIAFDSDDPEFTRGFEAGVLWQAMEAAHLHHAKDEMTIHASNTEMAMRISEHHGLWFKATPADGDFIYLTFGADSEHDRDRC